MNLTHKGKKMTVAKRFALSHADALTRELPFTMVYADSCDALDNAMDASTIAFIATLLPALAVADDVEIHWHTTIHGIIIKMDIMGCRLPRMSLVALASDERIRWVECRPIDLTPCADASISIGLMFLKEYEAL